jgi:uncharacterized membrane protein (DUF485 family)
MASSSPDSSSQPLRLIPPHRTENRAPSGPRSTLPFVLSAIMIAIYFGFIFLVAYAKPFLGSTIVPGLSWGILLGALVIVAAWLLTLFYVIAYNRRPGPR